MSISALPDKKKILMMILIFPLQKRTYQAICKIILIFLKNKTLFKQVKLLNIRAQKQAQEAQVFSNPFYAFIPLSIRIKLHGKSKSAVATHFCLQAASIFVFLRGNVWSSVPAKEGLQKLGDLI